MIMIRYMTMAMNKFRYITMSANITKIIILNLGMNV